MKQILKVIFGVIVVSSYVSTSLASMDCMSHALRYAQDDLNIKIKDGHLEAWTWTAGLEQKVTLELTKYTIEPTIKVRDRLKDTYAVEFYLTDLDGKLPAMILEAGMQGLNDQINGCMVENLTITYRRHEAVRF